MVGSVSGSYLTGSPTLLKPAPSPNTTLRYLWILLDNWDDCLLLRPQCSEINLLQNQAGTIRRNSHLCSSAVDPNLVFLGSRTRFPGCSSGFYWESYPDLHQVFLGGCIKIQFSWGLIWTWFRVHIAGSGEGSGASSENDPDQGVWRELSGFLSKSSFDPDSKNMNWSRNTWTALPWIRRGKEKLKNI